MQQLEYTITNISDTEMIEGLIAIPEYTTQGPDPVTGGEYTIALVSVSDRHVFYQDEINPDALLEDVQDLDGATQQTTTSSSNPTAADLIAQAKAATTAAQLDAIEAQAAGRVTVLDAVSARRQELGV